MRPATAADADALWAILEPTIRAGDTYQLPRDMTREAALAYWLVNDAWITDDNLGTYYVRDNPPDAPRLTELRTCNAGYMTHPDARGRGIARAMCAHSLDHARARGYAAMQFNFVVSTNERAVKLWQAMGFSIARTLSAAFAHPTLGAVDAFVMHRAL